MNVSSLAVLRSTAVRRSLPLSLIARLPSSILGLLLILRTRELGLSYAVGGLASGGYALGTVVGAPLLARAIDRRGQPQVLWPCAGAGAVVLVSLATLAAASVGVLLALAVLAGFLQPPISSCARAIWATTLDRVSLHRVLALEASLQELTFGLGPVAFVFVATHWNVRAAFAIVAGLLLLLATAAFARSLESRSVQPLARTGSLLGRGAMASEGVRLLFAITLALGASFGAIQIGVVARADSVSARGEVGILYGIWNFGSLCGGLLSAQRASPVNPSRRVKPLLLALAVLTATLSLTPGLYGLGAGLFLAGTCIAPLLAVVNQLTGEVAPATSLTEAYALESTALMAGIAVGAAIGGVLTTLAAPEGAFVAGAVGLLLAMMLVRARPDALRRGAAVAAGAA